MDTSNKIRHIVRKILKEELNKAYIRSHIKNHKDVINEIHKILAENLNNWDKILKIYNLIDLYTSTFSEEDLKKIQAALTTT